MERSSASMYRHSLIRKWLPAMPQVVAKLTEGGSSLDVGLWERSCGDRDRVRVSQGQSFSASTRIPDRSSAARANAKAAGLGRSNQV